MKVLIVEDDADMSRLLRVVTEGLDVETEEAPYGESAIHGLETGDDPDLVLVDLHLPEMSGEEVFDMIRKNSRSAIVIVTADILAAPEFVEKADGEHAYITLRNNKRRGCPVDEIQLPVAQSA